MYDYLLEFTLDWMIFFIKFLDQFDDKTYDKFCEAGKLKT